MTVVMKASTLEPNSLIDDWRIVENCLSNTWFQSFNLRRSTMMVRLTFVSKDA